MAAVGPEIRLERLAVGHLKKQTAWREFSPDLSCLAFALGAVEAQSEVFEYQE